jgi:hypothetical protein
MESSANLYTEKPGTPEIARETSSGISYQELSALDMTWVLTLIFSVWLTNNYYFPF